MQHIDILVLLFFCYMLEFENLVFVQLYVITLSSSAAAGGDITCRRQISPERSEDITHASGVDITARRLLIGCCGSR